MLPLDSLPGWAHSLANFRRLGGQLIDQSLNSMLMAERPMIVVEQMIQLVSESIGSLRRNFVFVTLEGMYTPRGGSFVKKLK
jgi:hypothetical protein